MKHKERKIDGKNKFHIYPKRRFPELKGDPNNISIVNIQRHADYHQLFGLRTPEEIIEFLNQYFWNGNYEISIRRK